MEAIPAPTMRIPMMTRKAIMCLSARLFLKAFRALLSIRLSGASSIVLGAKVTGSTLFLALPRIFFTRILISLSFLLLTRLSCSSF